MELKFTGKITSLGAVQTGEGKSGQWTKVDFEVHEQGAEYPQSAVFTMMGKNVENFVKYNKVDDIVEVLFSMKIVNYNNKKYNGVNARRVNSVTKAAAAAPSHSTYGQQVPDKDEQPF